MSKLGSYLQSLEEAQGIRTAARDEAEGSIGQRCPRVGPKEAQEGSSTREAWDSCPFSHLAPWMAPQPSYQHCRVHNVQTHHYVLIC